MVVGPSGSMPQVVLSRPSLFDMTSPVSIVAALWRTGCTSPNANHLDPSPSVPARESPGLLLFE